MKIYQLINYESQRYVEFTQFFTAKEFALSQMEKHGQPWAEISVYEKSWNDKTKYYGAYYVDSDGNVNGLLVNARVNCWILTIFEDVIDTIYTYKDIHDIVQSMQFLANINGECSAELKHVKGADTETYDVQILEDGLMFSNKQNFRHF